MPDTPSASPSLQRWTFANHQRMEMKSCDDGEWVLAYDVDRALQQLTERVQQVEAERDGYKRELLKQLDDTVVAINRAEAAEARVRALEAQQAWHPIDRLLDPDREVLMWTPRERLYTAEQIAAHSDLPIGEQRVTTKRHWTWATHYRDVPAPPADPGPRDNGERVRRFNATTGVLSGGTNHPDRCRCQDRPDRFPGTPHKHYEEPPYSCARCACDAYAPADPGPRQE